MQFCNTKIKKWCATISNSSSRLLEDCCNNVDSLSYFFQRGPSEKEASYFGFTIQRPGDLIYVASLRPHAVFTLDTGKPTILSVEVLLPSLIQLSSRGRSANTLWEYDVPRR